MSSASNFLLILLVARNSTSANLGLLLVGYAILTLSMSLCRNAFGVILGLDFNALKESDLRILLQRSLAGVFVTGLVTSGAIGIYANLLTIDATTRMSILIIAVGSPIVLVQDFQRFWTVAAAKPHYALIADALWFTCCLVGFLVPLVSSLKIGAQAGVAFWAMGAITAFLSLSASGYLARPKWRGTFRWLRQDSRRLRLGADALLASSSPLANASAIAAMAGPQVTAAVRGAGALFGPLNVLSATIPLAVVPEAIRGTAQQARKLFRGTALLIGALSLVWGTAIALTPDGVGSQVMGPTWQSIQSIILITTMEYVGLGFWASASAQLRAKGHIRRALQLRIIFAISSLLLPIVAVAIVPSATAYATALALNTVVLGAMANGIARRAITQVRGGRTVS